MKINLKFYSRYLLLTTALNFLMLTACDTPEIFVKEPQIPDDAAARVLVGSSSSNVSYQILYAGQTINAGSVFYDDIDTNGDLTDDALRVTFQTTDGWEIMEVQFFLGASITELPVNKSGNPQPGQFPLKSGALTGLTTYMITVPFSDMGFACPSLKTEDYFVAAHAALRKRLSGGAYQYETGWGDGLRLVQRGSWAMYNMIFITCDINTPPSSATTETAFAFDGDQNGCFQNFSEFIDNPNRWGWTNGPYSTGSYKFPIYAGAGKCDLNKGIMVGYLLVDYNGSSANFNYQLTGSNPSTGLPYTLREVHLYAGNKFFPVILNGSQAGDYTIAPGKYPYKSGGLNNQTFNVTVPNLTGDIYIIAHAVVHGFPQL